MRSFFSFTFGGETLALAAALETMQQIRGGAVIPHLWEQGLRLKDGFNVLARELDFGDVARCIGLPPRTIVEFRDTAAADALLVKSLFQQECVRRGILFTGGHNICFSHSATDIDATLRAYRAAIEIVRDAIRAGAVRERLEGEPMQPVFRKP